MKQFEINSKIFEQSLNLDMEIILKLSSLMIKNSVNMQILIEQNNFSKISNNLSEINIYENLNSNKEVSNDERVENLLSLFNKVNYERKLYKQILIEFLKQKFWQIQMSSEQQQFIHSKVQSISGEIQNKKICQLEKDLELKSKMLNLEKEKVQQLQNKIESYQNIEQKISNDNTSVFLEQLDQMKNSNELQKTPKKLTRRTLNSQSSKNFMMSFQEKTNGSNTHRRIKKQGSFLGGFKGQEDKINLGKCKTNNILPNEYALFDEEKKEKKIPSRLSFNPKKSFNVQFILPMNKIAQVD